MEGENGGGGLEEKEQEQAQSAWGVEDADGRGGERGRRQETRASTGCMRSGGWDGRGGEVESHG